MNRGRRYLKVALQVRLRGRLPVDLRVVVDGGQVLTLLCGEGRRSCRIELRRGSDADIEGILAKAVENADFD
jgi:hypothetical protein